ncbi:MAG: surface-adhesin E family protein [Smithella sp.]
MKTIGSVITLLFVNIVLLVTSVNGSDLLLEYNRGDHYVTPVIGSNVWKVIQMDNNDNVFSYNTVSISHQTTNIVQVWEKMVYSEKGRAKHTQDVTKKGYDKLSHSLHLVEVDCKKGMSRFLSITDYDKNGLILNSDSFDKPEWNHITPDTPMDTLRKKVCE